ncbi:MAG TPA: PilZ domain-containing protein [Phycisphaerae bacterium]|nr:PilZ domain-containing protein [Phycisphaerae bacterium]
MDASQRTEYQPITPEQWTQLVTQHGADAAASLLRRRQPRYYVQGPTRVAFSRHADSSEASKAHTCSVLDISNDGLMLRCREQVPLQTPLAIELYFGDQTIMVFGTVVHCTQTVGAFKIGVKLRFDEPA